VNLTVLQGDITQVKTDALVNAANTFLRGGGGVDGAVHRAAGPDLLEYLKFMYPHGTETAVPVFTPAFNIDADDIIHVPGPDARPALVDGPIVEEAWSGFPYDEQLWHSYSRSLVMADALGAETVTFPSLSTGIYGFPLKRAVPLALNALRSYTPTNVHTVAIVAFDDETFEAFRGAL
jgi:O-acetyl-ADP-ribose deacetylase (regulator of RNase III)